mmetsp:Transcript_48385/g.89092  ORF Transcript_48385/g.89092 Transcript_48385/m.89092 type:complete len:210 (+) Transcript_48385:482-1111(+)
MRRSSAFRLDSSMIIFRRIICWKDFFAEASWFNALSCIKRSSRSCSAVCLLSNSSRRFLSNSWLFATLWMMRRSRASFFDMKDFWNANRCCSIMSCFFKSFARISSFIASWSLYAASRASSFFLSASFLRSISLICRSKACDCFCASASCFCFSSSCCFRNSSFAICFSSFCRASNSSAFLSCSSLILSLISFNLSEASLMRCCSLLAS